MGTKLDAKRLEILAEMLAKRSTALLLADPTTHRESRPAHGIQGTTEGDLDVGDIPVTLRQSRPSPPHGRRDVLIKQRGVLSRSLTISLERVAWDQVLATNLTDALLCAKDAARVTSQRGSGSVVNIASICGLTGPQQGVARRYAAAKHDLIGLTRANAIEFAPLGIRVNTIALGFH
jgi:NAD(P)-dependent dehydrogenase (short-subunit alcohol dehydrogenase family)